MEEKPLQAGEITQLTEQTHDSDRISVFIDEEFAFGVHKDLVLKHSLHTGRVLSVDEQRALIEADQVIKAKQRALNYLAHKPRTKTEVRRKLRRNDVPAVVIDQVIDRMVELGYLDDQSYAQEYVRRRFASKGYGPIRIRSELKKRGIDRHLAETAIEEEFAEVDVVEAAREAAEKRWARLSGEEDPRKRRDKLYRHLKRRGYTYDTIRIVIEEIAEDPTV